MRTIVNYLRQVFCKHDFIISEGKATTQNGFGNTKEGIKVYMICKKCGYHSNHWKFL